MLIKRILCHWAIIAGVAFALLFCLHVMVGEPDQSLGSHLSAMWERHSLVVYVLVALLPASLVDLIRLSHRFAGPMVRFRRALKALAAGEHVSPLHFRDHDSWTDLAENFNLVLMRVERLEAAARTARRNPQLDELECDADAAAPAETFATSST